MSTYFRNTITASKPRVPSETTLLPSILFRQACYSGIITAINLFLQTIFCHSSCSFISPGYQSSCNTHTALSSLGQSTAVEQHKGTSVSHIYDDLPGHAQYLNSISNQFMYQHGFALSATRRQVTSPKLERSAVCKSLSP